MKSVAHSSLVPISQAGAQKPLYVVHGAGGGIFFLKDFARALEGHRPVYGFRAHGLDGSAPPDLDIGAMVSRYVADLCAQDRGPYLLGGYSSGGTIALEMATQLQKLGRQVSRVVLFDCWPRGDATQPRVLRHLRLLRYLLTDGYRPVRPFLNFIAGNRFKRSATLEEPERDDVTEFFQRTLALLEHHRFARYDVDTVLIKSELNWPSLPRDYGWTPLLERPLDIRIAPGHHITMWWPEFAPALASLVEELLITR